MNETMLDIQRLAAACERGAAEAGAFLRKLFDIPRLSLSERDVITLFGDDFVTVALSMVTPKGAPNVVPVDALLWRGSLWVPTVQSSGKAAALRATREFAFDLFRARTSRGNG